MNYRLFIIIIILAFSCKTKIAHWETMDFGAFKLKTPTDWKKFKEQGVDAYVGGLTNGKDSLWFYFGSYISGFQGDNKNYLFAQDTINGKIAAIKIPKKDSSGSIQMFINNAADETKFVLASSITNNKDVILQIFKTVTFKNSDTTKNGTISFARFKPYPIGSGSTIYQEYCTACHSRDRVSVGPALTLELINSRTKEWLYTFFKDRKHLIQDSAYLARRRESENFECIQFEDEPKQEVQQLVDYLKE